MAPRLDKFMRNLILSKIRRGDSSKKIAEDVSSPDCTVDPRAVRRIRSTYARYGTATKPSKRTGPDRKITPLMPEALLHRLAKEEDMTRREMALFLYNEYGVDISQTTITRAMQSQHITWKIMRRVALQQRPELRHFFQYSSTSLVSILLIHYEEKVGQRWVLHRC